MFQVGIFNVRVVLPGEGYGRGDCITNEGPAPLVEFYDATQDPRKFGDRGQFIGRYYCETLMYKEAHALNLHSGVPSWTVSEEQMRRVKAYLQGFADGRAR